MKGLQIAKTSKISRNEKGWIVVITMRSESCTQTDQDWSAYNLAQTSEKILFKRLTSDLLGVIGEEKPSGKGRKGYELRTKLFSLLLHTYTSKSSRKLISELKEAKFQGLIGEVPHFNSRNTRRTFF